MIKIKIFALIEIKNPAFTGSFISLDGLMVLRYLLKQKNTLLKPLPGHIFRMQEFV